MRELIGILHGMGLGHCSCRNFHPVGMGWEWQGGSHRSASPEGAAWRVQACGHCCDCLGCEVSNFSSCEVGSYLSVWVEAPPLGGCS